MSDDGYSDYTDCISDGSEAELLRQAEFKATIAAQHQAEKEEFRAAGQQLTSVVAEQPPLPLRLR
jgi:hypothetical protein